MAYVKLDGNRLSTSASFTITFQHMDDEDYGFGATQSAYVLLDSAKAGMEINWRVGYVWMDGWERLTTGAPARVTDAADAFAATITPPYEEQEDLYVPVVEIYSTVAGGPTQYDTWCTGYIEHSMYADLWVGETSVSRSGTVGVKNVVAAIEVTDASYEYRASPRSFRDRSGEGRWYADGQSAWYASIGSTSAEDNADWIDEPIPVDSAVARPTFGLAYDTAAQEGRSYAEISDISFSEHDVSAVLNEINYWSTNGSDWTYSESNPGGQDWYVFGIGSTLEMQRIGGVSSDSASFVLDTIVKGPIRWNILAVPWANISAGYGDGLRFDGGLIHHYPDQPDEIEWLSAGLSEYYTELVWHVSGGSMPDVEKIELPDTAYCQVDEQYLEDTNRRLYQKSTFYRPDGKEAETTIDVVDLPIFLPSTGSDLKTTDPYWGPAITFSHENISVDIPPNESDRPSSYSGNNRVAVANENEFVVATGDGEAYVERELETRYWLRLDRMASNPDAEENLDVDWPIKQTANENLEDDDAAWATQVPTEDVTNWDNSSYLRLTFNSVPGDIGDETHEIIVEVNYSNIFISDDFYTCYEYRFGAEANWNYSRYRSTKQYTAKIQKNDAYDYFYGSSWGGVIIDLVVPDDEDIAPVLQHVDSVKIYFPENVTGTYELDDIRLISDPEHYSYHLIAQPAIDAWNWPDDYAGFGATMDGKPILKLPDGMSGKEEAQDCLKQHQERYHCPTTSSSTNICYAKALSRLATEVGWQEQLNSNYDSATVDANIEDEDGNSLGTLYWWDLERGSGDTVVDDGGIDAAMAIKRFTFNRLPSCAITLNCRFHIDGRAHGLYIVNGERGSGTSSGYTSDYYTTYNEVVFWQKETSADSPVWEKIGSCEPDYHGRFKTPAGKEDEKIIEDGNEYHDTPAKSWIYAISNGEEGEKNILGSFTSREYRFGEEIGGILGLSGIIDTATLQPAGDISTFIRNGRVHVLYANPYDGPWSGENRDLSWGHLQDTGIESNSACITETNGSRQFIFYTKENTLMVAESIDSFTHITGEWELASGKHPNVYFDDMLYHIVYWYGDSLYYAYSADLGQTLSDPVKITDAPEQVAGIGVYSSNRIVISYYDNDDNIKRAHSADGGTTFEVIDGTI